MAGSCIQELATPSEDVIIRHELVLIVVVHAREVRKVHLVAQQTADATEALHELGAFLRPVGDELKVSAKVPVFISEPFKEGLVLGDLFHLETSGFVHELVHVFAKGRVEVYDGLLCKT
jgi:hypothetical protein